VKNVAISSGYKECNYGDNKMKLRISDKWFANQRGSFDCLILLTSTIDNY